MAKAKWIQKFVFLYEKQEGALTWNDVDEKSWRKVRANTCKTVRVDYEEERTSINIHYWPAEYLDKEVIHMANEVMRPFYRLRSQGV